MDIDLGPLVEAKTEYQTHMNRALRDRLYTMFHNTFSTAVAEAGDGDPVSAFQGKLAEVPLWNFATIKDVTARVVQDPDTFAQLLTALLVIKTRIMTAIRSDAKDKSVKVDVPSTEHFVHHVCSTAAHAFQNNPHVFYSYSTDGRFDVTSYKEAMHLVDDAIESSVSFFVPMKNILQEYIASAMHAPDRLEPFGTKHESSEDEADESEKDPEEENQETIEVAIPEPVPRAEPIALPPLPPPLPPPPPQHPPHETETAPPPPALDPLPRDEMNPAPDMPPKINDVEDETMSWHDDEEEEDDEPDLPPQAPRTV